MFDSFKSESFQVYTSCFSFRCLVSLVPSLFLLSFITALMKLSEGSPRMQIKPYSRGFALAYAGQQGILPI